MTDNTRKAENGLQAACVAIVGAGAAGLVAAREFRRAGHAVQVFEQQSDIGGVWVPDDGELAGPGPEGVKVHTSMYESLRVNLPRELMSFSDFPFVPDFMQGRSVDARRFPHHTEVRQYLEAFADRYELRGAVHLNTRVTRVAPTPPSDGGGTTWQVDTVSASSGTAAQGAPELGAAETREFDAVVICNGHYTVPRMPDIEGLDSFPGRVEHSHMYRRPDVYSGERVLIVGAFATGEDLAWDIAPFAKSVTMSATSWMQPHYSEQEELFGVDSNMLRRPWVTKLNSDGSVEFEGGGREAGIDAIVICTGYQYTFPFLEDGIVDVVDSHVQPLYKHLLHPRYGASLAFIGLGYKNVPFPQCEVQAKYVAALLSGEAETPSQEAMEDWVQRESGLLKEKGIPDRHVHCMALSQFPYNDELAAKCGGSKTPAWRLSLVMHTMELWGKYSAIQYRDEWEDEEALSSTYAAFEAIRRAQ